MNNEDEVLVIFQGGAWDGFDYLCSREHFELGQTVACPYSEAKAEKMSGKRPTGDEQESESIGLYKFDEELSSDGNSIYLRHQGDFARRTRRE